MPSIWKTQDESGSGINSGFLTSSIWGAAVGYKFWRVRFHVIKAAIAAIWYKKSPWQRQQFHCNFIPSLRSGNRWVLRGPVVYSGLLTPSGSSRIMKGQNCAENVQDVGIETRKARAVFIPNRPLL